MPKKKEKPSQTALKVALNIIALGNVPEMKTILPKGIVKTTSELLRASGATSVRRIEKHLTPKIVSLYKKFDWLLPGQFEAFGYRKVFCESNVSDAINEGANQVLVLGAGYDTLGYRLSLQYPKVNFFEIDHPSTAQLKIKGVEKMGAPNNLHFIPEDLSEKKLDAILETNTQWNNESKSIIIAEGLLQYLPPKAVAELFHRCYLVTGLGSKIVFTYITQGADGRPNAGPKTGFMLWLLKVTGEPWLWAPKIDELKEVLNDAGWEYSPELKGKTNNRGIEYFACATRK